MHVLLVEPDSVLAKAYADALRGWGWLVSRAVSAQQAVSAADDRRPDVVVLALSMARHNGVEFLYEFKSYTEWRDVPVIVLVSSLNHDVVGLDTLRHDLGVREVLVRSQTTLQELCEAVARMEQPTA